MDLLFPLYIFNYECYGGQITCVDFIESNIYNKLFEDRFIPSNYENVAWRKVALEKYKNYNDISLLILKYKKEIIDYIKKRNIKIYFESIVGGRYTFYIYKMNTQEETIDTPSKKRFTKILKKITSKEDFKKYLCKCSDSECDDKCLSEHESESEYESDPEW